MSKDANARINNIPGGWTFEAYLDQYKNLFINVMNRTNTSVDITIGLNNPTAENLKDIGTAFIALASKLK
jgi:hypothetical protein